VRHGGARPCHPRVSPSRRTTHITVSVAEGNGKPSRSERRAASASSTASAAREKRTAGSKKKAAAKAETQESK